MHKPTIVPQTLHLTLNSSFRVLSAHDTETRCGPKGTQRTIKYTVDIESRPDQLDSRGFIIDWRDISLDVAKRYKYVDHFPSCERFALEICDLVHDALGGRCETLTVNVGIAGLPANMTAKWEAPATMTA